MLRNRFITLAGGLIRERSCKKVRVLKVDTARLSIFLNEDPKLLPKKGTIYNSIDALAQAMQANPVTLRAAISIARKDEKDTATVRGVTFTYVA
jgi:hypothetical protein